MSDLTSAKALLQKYGLWAKKSLGQNFLVDQDVLSKIADAAELTMSDTVIEIGPGLGVLTRELSRRAGRVIAIEIDQRMIQILKETTEGAPNVTVVKSDILETDVPSLVDGPYKVVANLPYYITSPTLRLLLESNPPPSRLVVMVQREVAQRIVAKPGKLSLLAISVQIYGTPKLVGVVPAESFYPAPDVASAILRVDVHPEPLVAEADREHFFKVVAAGFSQPRKQLHNALSQRLWFPPNGAHDTLLSIGIDSERRAQTLTIEEWIRLAAVIQNRPT